MTLTPILLAVSITASLPQEVPPSRFDDARFRTTALHELAPETTPAASEAATSLPRSPADGASGGLTWKQIAHRVGGALVGSWLGYFSAQVVRSDWDKDTNASFQDQRYSWAAAGAVVGLLGSHLIGTTRSPADPAVRSRTEAPKSGAFIAVEEIRESDARTAWELIYNRRSHWLITRGENSVAETARGETRGDIIYVTPGRDKIIVYMDDVRIGGVEEMRDISADMLTSVRFLDTREATMRYGGGHAHGAILLSTGVSR